MSEDGYKDWPSDAGHPSETPGSDVGRPALGVAGVQEQTIVCPSCRYNLTGATIGMACPECGMIVGAAMLRGTGLPSSGKAVAALVLGIVSIVGCIFACLFYGLPSVICGPLAIVFARQAKGQVKRGEVNPSSDSMATAGFVCGLIGTIIGGLIAMVIFGVLGMVIFSSP